MSVLANKEKAICIQGDRDCAHCGPLRGLTENNGGQAPQCYIDTNTLGSIITPLEYRGAVHYYDGPARPGTIREQLRRIDNQPSH